MSVNGQFGQVALRPFAGFAEPGLPSGMWNGRDQVTGDASGGNRNVSIKFNLSTNPINSLFYSLEFVSVLDTDNNQKVTFLTANNMDNLSGGTFAHIMRAVIGASAATPGAAALDGDSQLNLRKIFLGAQLNRLATTELLMQLVNVNGSVLDLSCEGYYWTPLAVNAVGGIRRPLSGLYSN